MTLNAANEENVMLEWNNWEYFPEEQMKMLPNLDVIVEVPTFKSVTTNTTEMPKLSVTMFNKSTMFNEVQMGDMVVADDRIVSITTNANETVNIAQAFQIHFKMTTDTCNNSCGYWKYGQGIKGQWEAESPPKYRLINDTKYFVCRFSHLTHFALLVGATIDPLHARLLNIITACGSSLSTFGIFAIIITALISKAWRDDGGRYILIQFSVIVLLKYLLLYISGMEKVRRKSCETTTACIVIATLLHYILLAEFTWMLILAVLQYKRFVQVFYSASSEVILKISALGWLLPLAPALAVFIYNRFVAEIPMYNKKICYPEGWSLYLGVLLPIFIIIFCNILIFGKIIYSVVVSKINLKRHGGDRQGVVKISLKLGIFLFSLLGLSWVFGFLLMITNGIVFAYLFCVSSTLQGVVMFIYFIVWNENSRKMWTSRFSFRKFRGKLDLSTKSKVTKTSDVNSVTYKSREDSSRLCGADESD